MRYQWRKPYVRWITLFGLLALAAACSRKSTDEGRLRRAMAEMVTAAEAKQVRPILDYLAEEFQGNGSYRKANIGGMLYYYYQHNRHVQVFLHIVRLKISGAKAAVRCQVVLSGRDQKLVPDRARVLVIDSQWHRTDGEWRVQSANWRDGLVQP